MRILKLYQRGIITEGERLQPGPRRLDPCPRADHHRNDPGAENDYRFPGYVNPIFLMADSGARGGVEQNPPVGRLVRADGQAFG